MTHMIDCNHQSVVVTKHSIFRQIYTLSKLYAKRETFNSKVCISLILLKAFNNPSSRLLQAQLPFISAADQGNLLDLLWSATTASITLLVASWLASADKLEKFNLMNPTKKRKYCIWQAQYKPFCKQCNPSGTKRKLWVPNRSPAYIRPYNYIQQML